jgi:hypothetical protein
MARTYKRDSIGRFAGGGGSSGGGGGKRPAAKSVSRGVNRLTRDNAGKITSVGGEGATARGGRLKTAAGNKRATVTAKTGKRTTTSGAIRTTDVNKSKVSNFLSKNVEARNNAGLNGKKPRSIENQSTRLARAQKRIDDRKPADSKVGQAKSASRKEQLAAGAKKRNAQADRIDARVKKLEGEYRGKDAAFYTQGAKPAGRDRMIAKSQQAAQLREQSVALRSKAANAEKMASKIKDKPVKSSGGDARLERAIKNEAAGSTSYRRNPKGYKKRIAAVEAQKIYKTGDVLSTATIAQMSGKGFRLPRDKRTTPKPTNAAPKSTARPLSQRETQNLGLAKSNLAISKERLAFAREAKSTAKGPLEKLKATDRINEQQSNIRQINNKITAINARPAPGRPITGADRPGNRKQLSAFKKSGAIKGSIKRNASASSNLKNKSALNAGKYKNIYMANANKAAAAKRKRKP